MMESRGVGSNRPRFWSRSTKHIQELDRFEVTTWHGKAKPQNTADQSIYQADAKHGDARRWSCLHTCPDFGYFFVSIFLDMYNHVQ